MTTHNHICQQCGGVWRTDCRCTRGAEGDGRAGYCRVCRDEALLLGLLIGADIFMDGEFDGDCDDEL